jgi:hypothetical protein
MHEKSNDSVERMKHRSLSPRTNRWVGAIGGGVFGTAGIFLYVNLNAWEKFLSGVKGDSPWSLSVWPFVLPEAVVGALTGFALVLIYERIRMP